MYVDMETRYYAVMVVLIIIGVIVIASAYISTKNHVSKMDMYRNGRSIKEKTKPKKYHIKIEYKRSDCSDPEVVETYWYRNKFFRWWKKHVNTVGKNVTITKNLYYMEKYSLEPYFTEWEE